MKIVFDVSAGRLAIEGDGPELFKLLEAAKELVPSISQIQIVTGSKPAQNPPRTDVPADGTTELALPSTVPSGTLRQFARSLTLANIAERIAAIAYYVNKVQGRPSFSPKEMEGWFTMCGFQKPAQMSLALFDTKRKYGYADNFSRGLWRVSNQGENLIIAKIEESGGPSQ
jgi:hypothetical protein